ncbi:MAG: hypothetical protein JW902_14590 [Syntrophaceae bacterium]|nr:hypothetical protein [Syntrophaceae bacterium]
MDAFTLGGTISHYQVLFLPFYFNGEIRIAIRSFEHEGRSMVLAVDPVRLETTVIPALSVDFFQFVPRNRWRYSRFYASLLKHTSAPYPLQNDGLTEADAPIEGTLLTADLCPSRKPLEKRLFEELIALCKEGGVPVPVGIAISGIWAATHGTDLQWLIDRMQERKLTITWINHSFSHPYDSREPLHETFLLTPGINFKKEILLTEAMLLGKGLLPSIFFRFPGLVSDRRLIRQLRKLSLIPVGSRAWLAKGESPAEGSIILVHGNGNEPQGIDLFLELFRKRKDDFVHGSLKLRPLSDAVAAPENGAGLTPP